MYPDSLLAKIRKIVYLMTLFLKYAIAAYAIGVPKRTSIDNFMIY
jgi:hypothetical protein